MHMKPIPQTGRSQRGLSLVELMVGMTVGLIVLTAVFTIYITAMQGGRDTLNAAKLNVELRGAMDVMVEEIRRAGSGGAGGPGSPFMNRNTATFSDLAVSGTGNCIEFSYDANGNGTLGSDEYFGFRIQNNAIEMRNGGTGVINSCTNGTWERLTDPAFVTIPTLPTGSGYFSVAYQCLNTGTNTSASQPCLPGNSLYDTALTNPAVNLIELREVTINLPGQLVNDTNMRIVLNQHILVRNHRVVAVGTP